MPPKSARSSSRSAKPRPKINVQVGSYRIGTGYMKEMNELRQVGDQLNARFVRSAHPEAIHRQHTRAPVQVSIVDTEGPLTKRKREEEDSENVGESDPLTLEEVIPVLSDADSDVIVESASESELQQSEWQIVLNTVSSTEKTKVPIDRTATLEKQQTNQEEMDEENPVEKLLAFAKRHRETQQRQQTGLSLEPHQQSTTFDYADQSEETERLQTRRAPHKPDPPKKLQPIEDHDTFRYPSLTKSLLLVSSTSTETIAEKVAAWRELDNAKIWIRGEKQRRISPLSKLPSPLSTVWDPLGLPPALSQALEQTQNASSPFPVQAVATPILLSGHNAALVAQTGSGKTLAYGLPLLRHVHFHGSSGLYKNWASHIGPIGLVLVPTQELASQVERVLRPLAAALGLRVEGAHAGIPLTVNISRLTAGGTHRGTMYRTISQPSLGRTHKSSCEILVATPGRLYAFLAARDVGIIQLRRTSFVVLDEADRLLDDGFGPHVRAILQQIRPDRQTVLVSATLPRELSSEVRRLMPTGFVEMVMGVRKSTPSHLVEQTVELFDPPSEDAAGDNAGAQAKRTDSSNILETTGTMAVVDHAAIISGTLLDGRWKRLLQILAEEEERFEETQHRSLILIFVASQAACDALSIKLRSVGYSKVVGALSSELSHMDRSDALRRFRHDDRYVLVATSIAERGLDLQGLDLVINYSLPDHYESYVNRVGRTGRARRKGRAISFFCIGDDDFFASELIRALEMSHATVPPMLYTISAQYRAKQGAGQRSSSSFARGYKRGRRFRFDPSDRVTRGGGHGKSLMITGSVSSRLSTEDIRFAIADIQPTPTSYAIDAETGEPLLIEGPKKRIQTNALTRYYDQKKSNRIRRTAQQRVQSALKAARVLAETVRQETQLLANPTTLRQTEYQLNHLHERLRFRLASRTELDRIELLTDTSITVKGIFTGSRIRGLERSARRTSTTAGISIEPLHLQIRGQTDEALATVIYHLECIIAEEVQRGRMMGASLDGMD